MPAPKRGYSYPQQRQLIDGFDQLATLVDSGLPLRSALHVVATQSRDKIIKQTFERLFITVTEGLPLHQTAHQLPRQLSVSMIGYLQLAEHSGQFVMVLNNMVAEFNVADKQRRDIIAAVRYPIAILLMSIVISIGLLVFVLPNFTALFGVNELPQLTRSLLRFSSLLQQHGSALALSVIVVIVGLLLTRRYLTMQWQQLLFCLPILGRLFRERRKQQLFQRLALLLGSGMTAVNALTLTAEVSPWLRTRYECRLLAKAIANGNSWSLALQAISSDDPLVSAYITTGEQTGRIDSMMQRLARQLHERLQQRFRLLIGLIQPLLMLLLGGIIGTLLLAMYLPIFNLGQQF